ncbi:MAG: hypothetical protein AAFN77_01125 [Planctomycetota bacterium]
MSLPFPQPPAEQRPAAEQRPVNTDLVKLSLLARQRLAQMARTDIDRCQESFLFREDHFCGLRYSIGPFRATWFCGDSVIRFSRGGSPIGVVEIEPSKTRAA